MWTPPSAKFQDRRSRHLLLFVLTLATTTLAGAGPANVPIAEALFNGLGYSVPLLLVLGAHEFGHYYYCRKHNVDASLPYFLPAPPPFVLTGTLGAVIRIREPFPSKAALFDIGVAGPIAGFVALLPFLVYGVWHSTVGPASQDGTTIYFGEPLLFKAVEYLRFGAIAENYDTYLHPTGFAAWWGMLATALNLLPFGQLDGGHIVYSVLGRRATYVSMATLAGAVMLVAVSLSWISMAIMMLAMAFFLGFHHPRVIDEDEPLDARRRAVAVVALVIFALCFTPVPIQVFFGD